MSVYNYR